MFDRSVTQSRYGGAMERFPCTASGIREVRDPVAAGEPCGSARSLDACRVVDHVRPTGSAGRVGPIGLTVGNVDKGRDANEHAFPPSPKRRSSVRIWPIRICNRGAGHGGGKLFPKRWSTPTVFDSYFYIHTVLSDDLRTKEMKKNDSS
jgi:hypothetical protein